MKSFCKLNTGVKDVVLLCALVLFVIGCGEDPENVRLTNAAWKAYDAKEYKEAISHAGDCIALFEQEASKFQKKLTETGVPEPPVGAVSDAEEKAIHENGLLNDVATCHYIIGMSQQELGNSDEARAAYKKTIAYPHARAWDPKGWFWSPSVAASEKLFQLE